MRRCLAIIATGAAILAATPSVHSQEVEPLPDQPVDSFEPLPLIPEPIDPVERPRLQPEPPVPDTQKRERQAAEGPTALELLRQRIHIREVRSRALADPAVQAEWERANAASTDPEKREALRAYYTRLYSRMGKIDPTLRPQLEQQELESHNELEQRMMEPKSERGEGRKKRQRELDEAS